MTDEFHTTIIRDGVIQNAGGGGGGGGTYTNATPTPVTIGGIVAGSTFLAFTMQQMWDLLLYPYQYPAFTAFALDTGTVVEVGYNITGVHNFTFAWSNPTNVVAPPAPNGFYVRDMTAGADLEVAQPLASPIAHNFAGTVYHVDATNVYRIQGTNTLAGVFNRTYTVHWHWLYFTGPSANAGPLVEADIEGLATSALSDTYVRTYSFPVGATYKYICFPALWGVPIAFKDSATGFNVPMEPVYTVVVNNVYGDAPAGNYSVYRTTNIINAAIDIIVT
jgi:hypothetical protein